MKYLEYLPPIILVPLLLCLFPLVLVFLLCTPIKWNPLHKKI